MTNKLVLAVVLIAGLGFIETATSLRAHHSLAAEFDVTKMVTLTGSITEMKWTNPHSWLYIDVKSAKGLVQNWAIEFGSPNGLYRRGWRRTDLPVKATVTVTGYPNLDGSRTISATDVKLPDGRTLFAGTAQSSSP